MPSGHSRTRRPRNVVDFRSSRLLAPPVANDPETESGDSKDDTTNPAADATDPGSADADVPDTDETNKPQPIRFHPDDGAPTPSGWTRVPTRCEAPGGEEMIDRGAGWYSVAVPSEWTLVGLGSGGSGSPLGDSHDLSFTTSDESSRPWVTVSIDIDSRDDQGNLQTWRGEVSDGSFDYEITTHSADQETLHQITFDLVGAATVGDQQLDVLVADGQQAPEVLDETQYKARFMIADTPARHLAGGTTPESGVVTISHDVDGGELSLEAVRQIVESLQMPECTAHVIIVSYELVWNADLNEDGHISTAEEYQAALERRGN